MRGLLALLLLLAAAPLVAGGLVLESPDIAEGERIASRHVFNGYGCDGGNLSPELRWHGVPEGTRSFALIVFDPDAPSGDGWWHWLVFDIPAEVRRLPRGAGTPGRGGLPEGARQGVTSFRTTGYGGPCPPRGHGPHRYIFTLYALDVPRLDADEWTPPGELASRIGEHSLGSASITAIYSRD